MTRNVGGIDRIVRIAVGLGLIGMAYTGNIGAWGYIGLLPLATGSLGWCPPYSLLGINTCSVKK